MAVDPNRFTRKTQEAFAAAQALARDTGNTEITPEHLLVALLEQELPSPHRLSDLAVDGDDLIVIGFRPGPDLGRALQELLELVVDDPSMNDRDRLFEHAKVEGWPASRAGHEAMIGDLVSAPCHCMKATSLCQRHKLHAPST